MAQAAVSLIPPSQLQNPIPSHIDVPGLAHDGPEHHVSLASHYHKLRELDSVLDSAEDGLSHARQLYQETLEALATLCHEIWQREKAQGNHQGKGFRQSLEAAGIKVRRAYRAMKKFFPSDFPTQPKSLIKRKIPALCAAHKVPSATQPMSQANPAGVSQGSLPSVRFAGTLPQGNEVLECLFTLTPQKKAEVAESLKRLDPAQVQELFLQALQQAQKSEIANKARPRGELASRRDAGCNAIAPNLQKSEIPKPVAAELNPQKSEIKNQKSEILNSDAGCNGIVPNGASAPCAEPNLKKSEIENQKSQIPHGLVASSQKLEAHKSEIKNQKSEIPKLSRQMLRAQQRRQNKEQRRLERFLDQILRNP